ncbi:MAG: hypothetical protein V7752_05130 [Halopseudomonas sp.]
MIDSHGWQQQFESDGESPVILERGRSCGQCEDSDWGIFAAQEERLQQSLEPNCSNQDHRQ